MDRKLDSSAAGFVPRPRSAGSNTAAAASPPGNAASAGHVRQGEQEPLGPLANHTSTGYEGLASAAELGAQNVYDATASLAHGSPMGHPYQQALVYTGGMEAFPPRGVVPYQQALVYTGAGVRGMAAFPPRGVVPYQQALVYTGGVRGMAAFPPRGVVPHQQALVYTGGVRGMASAAEHGGHNVSMAVFAPDNVRHQAPSNATGYPYPPSFVPDGVRDIARGNPMTGYPYPPSFVPSGVSYYQAQAASFLGGGGGGVHPNQMTRAINPAGSFTTADQPGYATNDAAGRARSAALYHPNNAGTSVRARSAAALYDASTSASTGQEELPPDLNFLYEHHQYQPPVNAVHPPDWASSSNPADIYGDGYNCNQHDPWPGSIFTIPPPAGRASSSATENGVSPHSSKDSFTAQILDLAMEPNKIGYKNRLCWTWMNSHGRCPLGDRCEFAHGEDQQGTSPADQALLTEAQKNGTYKTVMCRRWMRHGWCRFGKICRFAHGPREFRR